MYKTKPNSADGYAKLFQQMLNYGTTTIPLVALRDFQNKKNT